MAVLSRSLHEKQLTITKLNNTVSISALFEIKWITDIFLFRSIPASLREKIVLRFNQFSVLLVNIGLYVVAIATENKQIT